MSPCEEGVKLLDSVQFCLGRLAKLVRETQTALEQRDLPRSDALDREIEHLFGQKERALGAYRHHLEEHGC